jgi:lipooligosaccharide transport system permease protein
MSTDLLTRIVPPTGSGGRRATRIIERNALVYRRGWILILSGAFEPLFYLFTVGVGIGDLVNARLHAPSGALVSYTAFVAPALLASSAMNGAVFDATFNVFFKLKYAKTYDAVLATPIGVVDVAIGEIMWALIRGTLYAVAFVVVMAAMGLIHSPWAVLALPGAVLIGFAFASLGMAATSYMRSWQDFDKVTLAVLPLFLFSGTFYPLSSYPSALQVVVECTPLYHGVALLRALCLGGVGWSELGHIAYLVALGSVALVVASRRLGVLLLK